MVPKAKTGSREDIITTAGVVVAIIFGTVVNGASPVGAVMSNIHFEPDETSLKF